MQVFGGGMVGMEGRVGDTIDTSRALDTTTMDMKQSILHKSKDEKKIAKVRNKHDFYIRKIIF